MGVGNYSSNFNSTGGTFIVTGPDCSVSDYNDFVKNSDLPHLEVVPQKAKDGWWNFREVEPSDVTLKALRPESGQYRTSEEAEKAGKNRQYERWAQDEVDYFNESLADTLKEVGRNLNLSVSEKNDFRDRAAFSSDFVSAATSKVIGLGWRSWETDFIVGIGAAGSETFRANVSSPGENAENIMVSSGYSPNVFMDKYAAVLAGVQEYTLRTLQDNGFECRHTTSSYTSSVYPVSESPSEEMAKLKESIQENLRSLSLPASIALTTQTPDERLAFIKAAEDVIDSTSSNRHGGLLLYTPLFNHISQNVLWVNPIESTIVGSAPASGNNGSINLAKIMQDSPSIDSLSPIPRNENTEAWFLQQQENRTKIGSRFNMIVVSGEEFSKATGKPFQVEFDSAGYTIQRLLLDAQKLEFGGDSTDKAIEKVRSDVANMLANAEVKNNIEPHLLEGLKAVSRMSLSPTSENQFAADMKTVEKASQLNSVSDNLPLITLIKLKPLGLKM